MLRAIADRINHFNISVSNMAWAVAGIVLFLTVWTVASLRMGNPVLLPDPAAVVAGFFSLLGDGTLLSDGPASMRRVVGGFAIAGCAAGPLGPLMAVSPRF